MSKEIDRRFRGLSALPWFFGFLALLFLMEAIALCLTE